MSEYDPSLIGNDYLVIGTVERKAWRENRDHPKPLPEMLEHVADFNEVVTFKLQPPGWYPKE